MPQTRARVSQESWSIPRALGPGPESPGAAGKNRRPRTRAQITWQRCRSADPRTRAQVERDSLSSMKVHGQGRGPSYSPGRAGRQHRPSDPGPCHQGELVDTACPRTRARGTRDYLSTPWAFVPGPESPRTGGRPSGNSNPDPIRPGQLVNTAVPRNRVRVTRQNWSTPRAFVHGPETPGTAGRPLGPSEPGAGIPE